MCIASQLVYVSKLYGLLTLEGTEDKQGILYSSPEQKRTNLESGAPNWEHQEQSQVPTLPKKCSFTDLAELSDDLQKKFPRLCGNFCHLLLTFHNTFTDLAGPSDVLQKNSYSYVETSTNLPQYIY